MSRGKRRTAMYRRLKGVGYAWLLATTACALQSTGMRNQRGELPNHLVQLPGPVESSQSWLFTRRRPGVDSLEQRIAEVHESEETVAKDPNRVRLVTSAFSPAAGSDTLVIDGTTFAPIEETSMATSLRFHYVYDGTHIRGTIQRGDSAARSIDLACDTPVFAFNELEWVVRRLAHRAGPAVVVSLFSEADGDVEHDTLTVLGDTLVGAERAWIIRFADPVIVTRYLVDARSRTLLEARTRQRRSGAVIRQVPMATARHLDVPRLEPVARHLRLVPRGRAQADTTEWSITRGVQMQGDRSVGLQVMVVTRGQWTTVDSVSFDPWTLVPDWEHSHGSDVQSATFSHSGVTARIARGDGSIRIVTTRMSSPVYSSTMDDVVVQSLPLADGYRAVLQFWAGDDVEFDTVRVRSASNASAPADSSTVWIVDLVEPHTTETMWIDRASRRITRHLYTVKQTGAMSELLAQP